MDTAPVTTLALVKATGLAADESGARLGPTIPDRHGKYRSII